MAIIAANVNSAEARVATANGDMIQLAFALTNASLD